ncbi:flavin reductase family protein [Brevibacillus choshinensis]|uniref:flavin reductase family protein n=1 Tax=Brevibacillus choshinensis TaxID=54911 RepID=UPI002E2443D8|nr:flavin reductase family protein [Brevibacillus choshinensis]
MGTNRTEMNPSSEQLVDRDTFRNIVGHFTSGVTIITTRQDETNWGITASAFSSVSLDPPMVLVCVNQNTGTCHAISKAKKFGVNILQEKQGDLARKFAQPQTDKFQGTDIEYGELGVPLILDVLAHFECRVVEEVTGGTHSVFLAEVQSAVAYEKKPLTYYRGKFGRFDEAGK